MLILLKDYSPEGAAVTIDFLEKYVLVNGAKELFQTVGKYSEFPRLENENSSLPKLQSGKTGD